MDRSTLRIAVIILAAITGIVHLYLGIDGFDINDRYKVLWVLNGIGYFVLLGLLFLDVPFFSERRDLAHYLLMLFALVTIIAWWVTGGSRELLGYLTKLDEVLLIIATYLHLQATQESGAVVEGG